MYLKSDRDNAIVSSCSFANEARMRCITCQAVKLLGPFHRAWIVIRIVIRSDIDGGFLFVNIAFSYIAIAITKVRSWYKNNNRKRSFPDGEALWLEKHNLNHFASVQGNTVSYNGRSIIENVLSDGSDGYADNGSRLEVRARRKSKYAASQQRGTRWSFFARLKILPGTILKISRVIRKQLFSRFDNRQREIRKIPTKETSAQRKEQLRHLSGTFSRPLVPRLGKSMQSPSARGNCISPLFTCPLDRLSPPLRPPPALPRRPSAKIASRRTVCRHRCGIRYNVIRLLTMQEEFATARRMI